MGGVQFSSFYFLQELQKYPEFETQLLLPRNGQFSKLCEINSIPFSIYHSHPMWSSSLSLFYDSIRLPNPFAWVYNIIHIYYNSKSIRTILKQHKNAVILSKGLYSHFTTIIANRKLSNKLIWHFQDLISGRFGGFLLKIINYLAKIGPSYIICDGNSIFKSLNIYNQSKATIILNGVSKDLFQRTDKHRKFGRKEFNIPKIKGLKFKMESNPFDYLKFGCCGEGLSDESYEVRQKDSDINYGFSYRYKEYGNIDISYIKGNSWNITFSVGFSAKKAHRKKKMKPSGKRPLSNVKNQKTPCRKQGVLSQIQQVRRN